MQYDQNKGEMPKENTNFFFFPLFQTEKDKKRFYFFFFMSAFLKFLSFSVPSHTVRIAQKRLQPEMSGAQKPTVKQDDVFQNFREIFPCN